MTQLPLCGATRDSLQVEPTSIDPGTRWTARLIADISLCVRTTINLDDSLMNDLKRLAAESGCTLTSVINDALRESLFRRRSARRNHVELPVFHGTGLQPGVNITDLALMLEVMEKADGPW